MREGGDQLCSIGLLSACHCRKCFMYKSLHLILTQLYKGGANIIPTLQTGKLRHIGSDPTSQSKQGAQTGFKTWRLVPEVGALNNLTVPSLDQHSGSQMGKWWSQNRNKTDFCSVFTLQILHLLAPSRALGCVLDTVTSTMRQDRLNPSPWVALIMNGNSRMRALFIK